MLTEIYIEALLADLISGMGSESKGFHLPRELVDQVCRGEIT